MPLRSKANRGDDEPCPHRCETTDTVPTGKSLKGQTKSGIPVCAGQMLKPPKRHLQSRTGGRGSDRPPACPACL